MLPVAGSRVVTVSALAERTPAGIDFDDLRRETCEQPRTPKYAAVSTTVRTGSGSVDTRRWSSRARNPTTWQANTTCGRCRRNTPASAFRSDRWVDSQATGVTTGP